MQRICRYIYKIIENICKICKICKHIGVLVKYSKYVTQYARTMLKYYQVMSFIC